MATAQQTLGWFGIEEAAQMPLGDFAFSTTGWAELFPPHTAFRAEMTAIYWRHKREFRLTANVLLCVSQWILLFAPCSRKAVSVELFKQISKNNWFSSLEMYMLPQMCNYWHIFTQRNKQISLTSFTNLHQTEACLPIVASLNTLTFCMGLAACAFNSTAQCRLAE